MRETADLGIGTLLAFSVSAIYIQYVIEKAINFAIKGVQPGSLRRVLLKGKYVRCKMVFELLRPGYISGFLPINTAQQF